MTDTTSFFNALQQADTVVVTPNRRLSATLHQLFRQYQLDLKKQCWPTPDILPISTWIERLWRDYTSEIISDHPFLLNSVQEQFLWKQRLVGSLRKPLLRLTEAADHVKSAWSLLKQWQVDINHSVFKTSEDCLALYQWISDYQKICHDKNCLDNATLPNLIAEKIQNKTVIAPKHILLFGFTELSPQLQHLFTICRSRGSKVTSLSLSEQQGNCYRINLSDQETEILTMANWAKALLKTNPHLRIGCVIPFLDKIRDRVLQLFSEVFAEENTLSPNPLNSFFNISAGKSLAQYPVIKSALQLLSLHKKTVSMELFSHLLSSPFLGDAEVERIKRANFDKLLRQKNIKQLILSYDNDVLSLEKHIPLLAKRIQHILQLIKANKETLSYSEWAKFFNQFLTESGWPGERSLNSEEYQTVENWLKLFSEFSTLDHIAAPTNFQQALQTLQKMAQTHTFQPQTPDAPIQVLGVLEAAALPFDYLWISGMDDASWPPQPKPNPFIPKRLQRELAMPHATAERELIYCQQLTKQFKESAELVIFSHAEKNDELELQASPLIRHLPEINQEKLALQPQPTISERIYQSKSIEKILDEKGPAIIADEKIRGGVSVIKQQALCPFKAFAEWRLHAQELENAVPGLRSKDRGSILHKALEILWTQLKDHETLTNLSETNLNTLVYDAIDKALQAFPHSRNEQQKYIALEKQRLFNVIQQWLALEKSRIPFKVIDREKTAQLALKQLQLSIRIDRIDELSDGSKLIIDYKTGKHNDINDWFSERPSEPQLPLYFMLDPDHTIGIAFAQITAGESGFKGLSREDLEIKGVKLVSELRQAAPSWAEQLTKWQETFTKLSDDFYNGIAKVDPKESQTCNWCALKPLCRIYENGN